MVDFNKWVLISGRGRNKKKKKNRIGEGLNYEWVEFNEETLANCVVGWMRSP